MSFFADIPLARRIESAEARLSDGVVRLVAARRPGLRAGTWPIGGGVAVFGGPGSPFNKLIGSGFDGPPDDDRLAEVERAFADRAAPLQAEVATLASPAFHAALTGRGYVLHGFENVLGRPIARVARAGGGDTGERRAVVFRPISAGAQGGPDRSRGVGASTAHDKALPAIEPAGGSSSDVRGGTTVIDVAECAAEEFDIWLDVLVTGFAHLDATGAGSGVPAPPREVLVQVMGDMAMAPGFHRYLARIGGEPVGGASLRVDEAGVAQLAGAATLPAYRRRGVQRALLAARLEVARHAGCDLAVITTQPGTQSQANAQRQGFDLLYARAILVKSGR
jgi:GNAT superfamily N-acetyltransferase